MRRSHQLSVLAIPLAAIMLSQTAPTRAQTQVYDLTATIGHLGSGPSEFNFPVDTYVDQAGHLLVADYSNNRVQILTRDGAFLSEWTGFNSPEKIAQDSHGSYYIADTNHVRIVKLSSEGTILATRGDFPAWPLGIGISPNDVIAVASGSSLFTFDTNLVPTALWGGSSELSGLSCAAEAVRFDSHGNAYVACGVEILKIGAQGTIIDRWAAEGTPQDVFVDSRDQIFVAETYNHRVMKYTSDGELLATIGEGILFWPHGLSVASDGTVFVANAGNHRIDVFSPNPPEVPVAPTAPAPPTQTPGCAPPPPGMVSWWRGEGDATDFTGTNPGTAFPAVTYSPGKVGQGFHFDGSFDSYISVPDAPSLDLTGEISIEFWFNVDNATQVVGHFAKRPLDEIVNYGVNTNGGLGLYYNDPDYCCTGDDGNIFEIARIPSPSAGVFHHFAGTFQQVDPTHVELKIYVDGGLQKTLLQPGNLANTLNNVPVTIGTSAAHGERFFGSMDEISLYHRTLTAQEVLAIYSADSAGKCVGPAPTPEPPRHKVVVFLQGVCSSLHGVNNIDYGPFADLRARLTDTDANPVQYGYASNDVLMYSYLGGTLDADTGGWRPNAYDDSHPVSLDFRTASLSALHDRLLVPYYNAHPNTTFVLVGHSLGGMVAMEEIAQHVGQASTPAHLVSGVITVDSPIHGVPRVASGMPLLRFLAKIPRLGESFRCLDGPSADILAAMHDAEPATTERYVAAASVAASQGVTLATVGNDVDCVWLPSACGIPMPSDFSPLLTQWLFESPQTMVNVFDVPPPTNGGLRNRIIKSHNAVLDSSLAPSELGIIAGYIGAQN